MSSTLTVLRDESVPYIQCPRCATRLDLPTLVGQRWKVRSPRDIDVLDHLVIGHDAYVSLRDRGVAFDRSVRSEVVTV